LLFFGIQYLFDKKRHSVSLGFNKLIIHKASKEVKNIDLSAATCIRKGINSIKIAINGSEETFYYKEFNSSSVKN
jgi:translation initiation factor IF-2